MCWCDKVKGRSLKVTRTTVNGGGNADIPGNPDRVSFRICGALTQFDLSVVLTSLGSGVVLAVITPSHPSDEVHIESMGQMVTAAMTIDNSLSVAAVTCWEAVLTEDPSLCKEQAH